MVKSAVVSGVPKKKRWEFDLKLSPNEGSTLKDYAKPPGFDLNFDSVH